MNENGGSCERRCGGDNTETHTMHQQIVTVRTENLDPMMRHGSHTKLQCGEKFSAPSQQGALSRRF